MNTNSILIHAIRVIRGSTSLVVIVPIVAIAQTSSPSEATNRGGVHFGACYTSVSGSGNRAETALRILFAASEVVGCAKTGGLADVAGSLPRALRQRGHDVAVV